MSPLQHEEGGLFIMGCISFISPKIKLFLYSLTNTIVDLDGKRIFKSLIINSVTTCGAKAKLCNPLHLRFMSPSNTKNRIFLLVAAVFLTACGTVKNVSYLQDIQPGMPILLQEVRQLTLQPGDRLRITVFSRDRELTELFNLNDRSSTGNVAGERHPYTVRADGTVEIPTLGSLHVQGLTRLEVADLVKYRLLSSKLLLDPTVIVEYDDLSFYALGEVGRTGRFQIPQDQVTILEALALAGDLTINGKRENVLVLRTENGVQIPYTVDLTNMESVYGSPAYYLHQNDVLYVEPNRKRAYQSDQNASTLRSLGFWMSIPSYITSLVLIINQFNK